MDFRQKSIIFVATGCLIGKIPFAPGTFGTIPGLVLCYFISGNSLLNTTVLIIILALFGIYISGQAEKIIKQKDPGCIVIDEIVGMAVTMIGIPFSVSTAIFGFIVFRLLDILKPFPIRYFDQKIKGGTGIVIDDVIAGCIGNIILHITLIFINL